MNDILHIAIGQQGTPSRFGNGGTFIIKQLPDGKFEKLMIAGGSGGSRNESSDYLNGSVDEFGNGPGGNRNYNIGSSGTDSSAANYEHAGAGYLENAYGSGDVVGVIPKCFEDGLQGAVMTKTLQGAVNTT